MQALGLLLSLLFLTPDALAVKKSNVNIHYFPVTKTVAKQVWFWEGIFDKHPSTTVLIHDTNYPEIIIDMIDYEVFAKKYGQHLLKSRRKREKFTRKYIERYELGIKRFKKLRRKAVTMGAIEQRLYNVYKRNPKALYELFEGNVKIRSQSGLSDEFEKAAVRAQQYLPQMKKIFSENGAPVELTRMAFVESMFNTAAKSKVGASGIWQFMPATARRFMYVNRLIDERNAPLKATRGAAKLLVDNFSKLRSWPLAITAYNHGVSGMKTAVRLLGTRDFDVIINNYKSRTFKYASKNFYAEFLAARNVYERKFRPKMKKVEKKVQLIPVKLTKKMTVAQLMKLKPLSKKLIKEFNLCLRPEAFTKYRHRTLPQNFEIFVPGQIATKVRQALATNTKSKKRRRRM